MSVYTSERYAIIDYLKSDLYERIPNPDSAFLDDQYLTMRSPLGWQVRLSGDRNDPTVDIFWPPKDWFTTRDGTGELFKHMDHCNATWLGGVLP